MPLQSSLDTYFGSGLLDGSLNMRAGIMWPFVSQRSKGIFLEEGKGQLGGEELGWGLRVWGGRGGGHRRNVWPWGHEMKRRQGLHKGTGCPMYSGWGLIQLGGLGSSGKGLWE